MYVNGVQFTTSENIEVTSTTGENNSSWGFVASFDNTAGRNKTSFSIGQEVIIYADSAVNVHNYAFPYTFNITLLDKLFTGTIEDISFQGAGTDEKIVISGRDYTSRLMDTTVEPSVYNNQETSVIFNDIIDSYTTGLTRRGVELTTLTITHISFNHTPVFDALKKLSDLSGFFFFVTSEKDIVFKKKGTIPTNVTLDTTNVLISKFEETDREMVNRIWVYGSRTLTATQDVFTANGGSVLTLNYNPHNTEVLVNNGSVPRIGGIFEVNNNSLGSPLHYLVDYDLKRIVFVSGTTPGDQVPASGQVVVVNYQRQTPIAKFGEDNTSIGSYGPHTKVIVDKNIIDPVLAETLVSDELDRNAFPKKQGVLSLYGMINITAGRIVTVNLSNQNISSASFDVVEVRYNFNTRNNLNNKVMDVRVSKKFVDFVDTLKQAMLDIKKIQAEDAQVSDLLTRLQFSAGSFAFDFSDFIVSRTNLGRSFILGHPINGLLGSPAPSVGGGPNVVLGNQLSGLTYETVKWRNDIYKENFRNTRFNESGTTNANWDTTNFKLAF